MAAWRYHRRHTYYGYTYYGYLELGVQLVQSRAALPLCCRLRSGQHVGDRPAQREGRAVEHELLRPAEGLHPGGGAGHRRHGYGEYT
mgnify:CR=1 FL=1